MVESAVCYKSNLNCEQNRHLGVKCTLCGRLGSSLTFSQTSPRFQEVFLKLFKKSSAIVDFNSTLSNFVMLEILSLSLNEKESHQEPEGKILEKKLKSNLPPPLQCSGRARMKGY